MMHIIRHIMQAYHETAAPAVWGADELDGPAPAPGKAGRPQARNKCNPQGPVGLLFESIFLAGLELDEELRIGKNGKVIATIVEGPIQAVQCTTRRAGARARTESEKDTRAGT